MFRVNSSRVQSLILQSGLNLSTFAAQAGLCVLTVKRALRGDAMTIKSIAALAKVFGVEPDELIICEGVIE